MAGDWIKIETITPDKPEVFQIAEMLEIDPDAVTGKLVRIWVWADQQTIDGNAPGVTKMLLDRLSGVAGFADAMLKTGWLKMTENGLVFSDFAKHNGKGAKKRAVTNRRVANHRGKVTPGEAGNGADRNAESVTESVTREEKRREESKTSSKFSPDDMRLAEFIHEGVLAAAPKTPEPNINKWANTVRLMREQDQLTHREVAEVFTWANRDGFWRTNILSVDKLRKQFPQLSAKMEAEHEVSNTRDQQFGHVGRGGDARPGSTVDAARAASDRRRQAILERSGHARGGHADIVGSDG